MNSNRFSRRAARDALARSMGFVLLALASVGAFAQQRPDAGQVLEQTRQPLRLPPPAEPVLPATPEPRSALAASQQVRVRVEHFAFSGHTLYSEEVLRKQVEEFIGKELDFEGLK